MNRFEAEFQRLLRDIAAMPEGDVDAMLQDTTHYPGDPEDDQRIKRACFARLAEIQQRRAIHGDSNERD
jgi:hypothetical protein